MKKHFLVLLILSSLTSIAQINTNALLDRPEDFEYLAAPDSTGKRKLIKTPPILANKNQTYQLKLPYPIIFIHGLNSNSDTWYDQTNLMYVNYNLSFGGRFDYCLNYNNNNVSSNTNFWPTANADIAVFNGTWSAGDYYYVNFDVGNNGAFGPSTSASNYVLSNQSAIVKQGKALHDAINRVLQLTGRDKVILMGHSMGGLASREYLQNPSNWQADGKTHVAKLATTGTPHGGSNATSFGIVSGNTDGQSEAIRDLRRDFYYSNNAGVYLFGGIESLPYMNDQLCCYFYNADVNCNGIGGTSENIVGLNQKNINYSGLDYSCIVGQCSGCVGTTNPGDGVVWNVCADLNNYYPNLTTNVFYYNASAAVEIHTDLPKQYYQNMQGLDEPNDYLISYGVGFNITYTGFTTIQPINGYTTDYDDYQFTVAATSIVTVNINSIYLSNLKVRIVETNTNNIGPSHQSGGSSSITFTQVVTAGSYYLEIYGTPTTSSYLHPYTFILNQAPLSTVGINEVDKIKNISIYPNPTKNSLTIEGEYFGADNNLEILNSLGQVVKRLPLLNNKTVIGVNELASGVYVLKFSSDNFCVYKKFVKE